MVEHPGYPNDSLKADGTVATDPVMISEIMYAIDDRSRLSQWIELRNTSDVIGVDVDKWSVFIVNHSDMLDADGVMVEYPDDFSLEIELDGRIPPGQSYLIAAHRSSDGTNLPDTRIAMPADSKRGDTILNPYGFQITVMAKTNETDKSKHELVDVVGNLMPAPEGVRQRDAQSFNDDVAWNWPHALNEDGERISVIRLPEAMEAMAEGW